MYIFFNTNTGQCMFCFNTNTGQCMFCFNTNTDQCMFSLTFFIINLVLVLKKYTLTSINDKKINEKYT